MLRTLRTRLRIEWYIAIHCCAFKVSTRRTERGTYPLWMCRRLMLHRGPHRDSDYPDAVWPAG